MGVDPLVLSAPAFEKLVQGEVALNTTIATAAGVKAN
jgi:hypothetical protein